MPAAKYKTPFHVTYLEDLGNSAGLLSNESSKYISNPCSNLICMLSIFPEREFFIWCPPEGSQPAVSATVTFSTNNTTA